MTRDLSDVPLKDLVRQAFAGAPESGDVYRYYKGGLCVVACLSFEVGTLEPLVTYRGCVDGVFRTRTLAEFARVVTDDGRLTRRFIRVEG